MPIFPGANVVAVSRVAAPVSRIERLRQITDAVGMRKLVWFGTRGEDAWPLLALPQFVEAYSLTARLNVASLAVSEALEDRTGHRVDLDTYDIDDDASLALQELRQRMVRSLREPAVLLAYVPSLFLSSVCFPNLRTLNYVGMFRERHAPFEHKPWVENSLRQAGVKVLPWDYVAHEDHLRVIRSLERGPLVLRTSRTSGGVGMVLVDEASAVTMEWPRQREAFVCVAPYLAGSIPLNVGACVFEGGQVTLHAPSLQLIGLAECTTRTFGYCGNDFAAISTVVAPALLDRLQDLVVGAGQWLSGAGYLGAFGIDALIQGEDVYLTEINPRFQGSSAVSAEIARLRDLPDIYLDHLAAYLHLEPQGSMTLRQWVGEQCDSAQIVCHNPLQRPVRLVDASSSATGELSGEWKNAELVPSYDTAIDPSAALFRLRVDRQVSTDGFSLDPECDRCITTLRGSFR